MTARSEPQRSSRKSSICGLDQCGPIPSGTVDIWKISLGDGSSVSGDPTILSSDERARTDRFLFERHGNQFTSARAAMRSILANYLKIEAKAVRFSYNDYGKPLLDSSHNNYRVSFNLSHSSEIAALAVCAAEPLGIDIEMIRRTVKFRELAKRYFSQAESDFISNIPESRLQQTFYRIWTCKEAYLKGHGRGLSLPLDGFDVTVGEDRIPLLEASRIDPEDPRYWQFREIPCHADYMCTLAYAGRIDNIRIREYAGFSHKDPSNLTGPSPKPDCEVVPKTGQGS